MIGSIIGGIVFLIALALFVNIAMRIFLAVMAAICCAINAISWCISSILTLFHTERIQ